MIIFADKQAIKQRILNSITEAHSNPLWSVDSRGAGQQMSPLYAEAITG